MEDPMSIVRDPARLRSTLASNSTLGQGLAAAQACGPDEEQLKALERKVFAAVGVTAVVATVAATQVAPAPATGALGAWLTLGSSKLVVALVSIDVVSGGGAAV
jgi:hypothetical protein